MCAAWYTVDCVNSTEVWTFAYWLQPGYHPYYPHFFLNLQYQSPGWFIQSWARHKQTMRQFDNVLRLLWHAKIRKMFSTQNVASPNIVRHPISR